MPSSSLLRQGSVTYRLTHCVSFKMTRTTYIVSFSTWVILTTMPLLRFLLSNRANALHDDLVDFNVRTTEAHLPQGYDTKSKPFQDNWAHMKCSLAWRWIVTLRWMLA